MPGFIEQFGTLYLVFALVVLDLEAAEHNRPLQTEPPSPDALFPSGAARQGAFRPPFQMVQFQECRVMRLVATPILHTAADPVLARGRAQRGLE